MSKYIERHITVNEEQRKYIEKHFGKMNIGQISKMLGITYNKTHNNLRAMGYVKKKVDSARVITMEGYFDEDKFFKHYTY